MIVKTTGVTQAVQEFILTTFPGATLLEIHQVYQTSIKKSLEITLISLAPFSCLVFVLL